jgi:hypothetical protein
MIEAIDSWESLMLMTYTLGQEGIAKERIIGKIREIAKIQRLTNQKPLMRAPATS